MCNNKKNCLYIMCLISVCLCLFQQLVATMSIFVQRVGAFLRHGGAMGNLNVLMEKMKSCVVSAIAHSHFSLFYTQERINFIVKIIIILHFSCTFTSHIISISCYFA